MSQSELKETKEELKECFVIMPISNQDGYEEGHFDLVYEDIFSPAIKSAGFKPYRADEDKSSSVIQVKILRKLIDAPMAICDVSSKNPNVLYELGIRQAFDKPVLLVGDDNPNKIFDISNINTYKYDRNLNYRSVLKDKVRIREMIEETFEGFEKGETVNSLLSLLKITNTASDIYSNKDSITDSDAIKLLYSEVISMKSDIKSVKEHTQRYNNGVDYYEKDMENILNKIQDYYTIEREGFSDSDIQVKSINCLIYDIEAVINKYDQIPTKIKNNLIITMDELKNTKTKIMVG